MSVLKGSRYKIFERKKSMQPGTRDRNAVNQGELSVYRCLPTYDSRMSAADKEKHLERLNISNVVELKAKLFPPDESQENGMINVQLSSGLINKRKLNAVAKPKAEKGDTKPGQGCNPKLN